jgi:RimJ/RimL family protein N-acetyltransferase
VEAGWRLAREHWACGYATEAARAALRVGFQQFALGSFHEFLIKMKADTA